jgi:hypothetical protein
MLARVPDLACGGGTTFMRPTLSKVSAGLKKQIKALPEKYLHTVNCFPLSLLGERGAGHRGLSIPNKTFGLSEAYSLPYSSMFPELDTGLGSLRLAQGKLGSPTAAGMTEAMVNLKPNSLTAYLLTLELLNPVSRFYRCTPERRLSEGSWGKTSSLLFPILFER